MDNPKEKYDLKLAAGKDFGIRENHWLPREMGVEVFVFGKIMYCRNRLEKIPDHEYLHVAQFRKYGTLPVIMHYLFYLVRNLIRSGSFKKAFSEIPFEVEARDYEYFKRNNNN